MHRLRISQTRLRSTSQEKHSKKHSGDVMTWRNACVTSVRDRQRMLDACYVQLSHKVSAGVRRSPLCWACCHGVLDRACRCLRLRRMKATDHSGRAWTAASSCIQRIMTLTSFKTRSRAFQRSCTSSYALYFTFISMHVYIYIYMYVCVYVCMYVWTLLIEAMNVFSEY